VGNAFVPNIGGSNPGRVKSETENLTTVVSLVSVHYLRDRAGMAGPVTEWSIVYICGMVLQCAGILKPGFSLDQLQQI